MTYYNDLREHMRALEAHGKLVRIKREINKDSELMPLVKWQFRGLPEEQRKAFLFENVADVKGRKFDIPVLVACHAASRDIYAMAMMCKPDEILEKWAAAQFHPVEPRIVERGPAQEEIHVGPELLSHGGLEEFPVPISTPGFDNAPYLSCASWITKDPETGIRNMGTYRAMVKSRTRLGIQSQPGQDLRAHWEKCRRLGRPLKAAIIIGAAPAVGLASTTKLPLGVDELAIAGGIAGEPIDLVKCKTVDLEVPATAEIVLEGELPTDLMEREAPFGEFTGYMGMPMVGPYFNIRCITHRKQPIYTAFISQFPPSESSKLRGVGSEGALYKFLRYDCKLPVLDVALHEASGSSPYCVVKLKKEHPAQGWQVLHGVATQTPPWYKFIVVVDEDINPRDADSVNWAISWRTLPERDIRIVPGRIAPMDYSVSRPDEPEQRYPGVLGASALLIDATRKWGYPPHSLPRREFMERARKIWEEEKLPQLSPKEPWFGYPLGYWSKELEEEAELALKGEHFKTGEKLEKGRTKI